MYIHFYVITIFMYSFLFYVLILYFVYNDLYVFNKRRDIDILH